MKEHFQFFFFFHFVFDGRYRSPNKTSQAAATKMIAIIDQNCLPLSAISFNCNWQCKSMMIYTQYSPFDDWFIFWFKMRPKFYKHRDEEGRERIFKCGNERLSLIIVRRSASSSVVVVVRLNYTLGIFNFEKSKLFTNGQLRLH